MTSIKYVVNEGDLLGRLISVNVPPIEANKRMTEEEVDALFIEIAPKILGVLLSAASYALRNPSPAPSEGLERMADCQQWVASGEAAFGWERGTFSECYSHWLKQEKISLLQSDPVAGPILVFLRKHGNWRGNASSLAKEAKPYQRSGAAQIWKDNGRWMADELRRIGDLMRAAGFNMYEDRLQDSRDWVIECPKIPAKTPMTQMTQKPEPQIDDDGDEQCVDCGHSMPWSVELDCYFCRNCYPKQWQEMNETAVGKK
jgi:hypothetical protein